jgi:hypothetical protein
MGYANISYSMSQADFDVIIASIESISSKMPFLVILDKQEKQAIFKHGPGSTDFTQEALFAAKTFPQILPASFDISEYENDTALLKNLSQIQTLINSLAAKINDTQTAIGGESMGASLEVYGYIQAAQDRVAGLKPFAERLKLRFKGQGKRKKKTDHMDNDVTPDAES